MYSNIQALLNQQAELAKKIAQAYGADARNKEIKAAFAAHVERKKNARNRFAKAFASVSMEKFTKALADAGWTQDKSDPKSINGTWSKKGSTVKINIDGGSYKITNGTEVIVPPSNIDGLPTWLNRPTSQPQLPLKS